MVKVKPKKSDKFASSEESADRMAEAKAYFDMVSLQLDDPVLTKLQEWEPDDRNQVDRLLPVPIGEPLKIKEGQSRGYARLGEASIKFSSDPMQQPAKTTGSVLGDYKAETRGLWKYGDSVVGMGSTDFNELLRVSNWMMLHNPLARNVVRGLTYLTLGSGVTVAWPGSARNGSGRNREKKWKDIERVSAFQRTIRRTAQMAFGLGEWFLRPAYDPKRDGDKAIPNRVLSLEPDRIERVFVNAEDAEDVFAYEVGRSGQTKKMVPADEIIHAKVEDYGNVFRGITPMLPALKYLRFAELFLEARQALNITRSRLPVIRKVKGSAAQLSAEKARLTKLPPPGTIILDPEAYDWIFPSLQIQSADATDDWTRIILAVAAGFGLPAHMVANDVSQGTYASTLIAESPTIRMIDDYRHFFIETWLSELVRRLSDAEDGFNLTFAPIIKRSIGENAQAVTVLVDREIWSRQTACEFLGGDWDGADGERERILAERDDGFGTGAGFGALPEFEPQKTELPNTRAPEPATGAALGAKGSKLPKQSA